MKHIYRVQDAEGRGPFRPGFSDICTTSQTRGNRGGFTVSNEFCEPINNNYDSWRDSWLAELNRRQQLGIKAAQRRHSQRPATSKHCKAKSFKYFREPRMNPAIVEALHE